MSNLTIGLGGICIALGLIAFFGTGAASFTALIPAILGVVFIILGVIARNSVEARKQSMHGAAVLALIGIFGSFSGLVDVIMSFGGEPLIRPIAAYSRAILSVLLIGYLIAAVKSFIDARRQQQG